MSNPSEILDAQINAGWKHADAYDGDDRQDIKSDVFNAFQAGVVWERRRALEGRPSLEMAKVKQPKLKALLEKWLAEPHDPQQDESLRQLLEDLAGAQAGAVQRPAGEGSE